MAPVKFCNGRLLCILLQSTFSGHIKCKIPSKTKHFAKQISFLSKPKSNPSISVLAARRIPFLRPKHCYIAVSLLAALSDRRESKLLFFHFVASCEQSVLHYMVSQQDWINVYISGLSERHLSYSINNLLPKVKVEVNWTLQKISSKFCRTTLSISLEFATRHKLPRSASFSPRPIKHFHFRRTFPPPPPLS